MACRPSVGGVDSSVIFLVVIGLWAAYLVPHWLRRREDLSASRSVDRFSAAMRVLTRRPPPEERPDHERTSAYVLTPAEDQVALDAAPADVPAPPRHAAAPHRPRRPVARTLAVLLGLALLGVPVLAGLGVAGVAPVWAAAPAAGLAVVLLVGLRVSARRRRSVGTRHVVPAEALAVVVHAAPDDVEDEPLAAPADQLFDEAEHTAREEDLRIRRLAEEALRAADVPYREPEPGEWTPVAVPLPAYLLKPHARPAWQPLATSEQGARAHRPDVDEDDIPTYAPASRRASGA